MLPPGEARVALTRLGRRSRGRAHELLRALVADCLGTSPARVTVRRRCGVCGSEAHGAPLVEGLCVSLAYADGLVALAAAHAPVGVDVERVTTRVPWPAARLVLPPACSDTLLAVPAPRRPAAFLAAWTAWEAVGKAVGVGLAVTPEEMAGRAQALSRRWTSLPLRTPPGHRGAVAIAAAAVTVREGWAVP